LLVGAVAAPPREAKASKEPLKVIEVIENELQRKVGRDVTANILTKLDARRA
jgi:hypothetical protein